MTTIIFPVTLNKIKRRHGPAQPQIVSPHHLWRIQICSIKVWKEGIYSGFHGKSLPLHRIPEQSAVKKSSQRLLLSIKFLIQYFSILLQRCVWTSMKFINLQSKQWLLLVWFNLYFWSRLSCWSAQGLNWPNLPLKNL